MVLRRRPSSCVASTHAVRLRSAIICRDGSWLCGCAMRAQQSKCIRPEQTKLRLIRRRCPEKRRSIVRCGRNARKRTPRPAPRPRSKKRGLRWRPLRCWKAVLPCAIVGGSRAAALIWINCGDLSRPSLSTLSGGKDVRRSAPRLVGAEQPTARRSARLDGLRHASRLASAPTGQDHPSRRGS
jgi:hypothetical protein